MSTHLQKITTRAKAIRKAKPAMKWTDAVKAASKELKAKKPAPKAVGYSPARKAGFKKQTKKIQAIEKKGVPHAKAVKQVVGEIPKYNPIKVYEEHLNRIKYFELQLTKGKLLLASIKGGDPAAKTQILHNQKYLMRQLKETKKMAAIAKRLI